VLQPQDVNPSDVRIREEAVPRTGTRVQRVPVRTRWSDGRTFVWVQRQRSSGTGEGSSALRYDAVVSRVNPTTPEP
jgi:hypothetical protein